MKPKAYSYIRFSRPEQIRGNSLTRQQEMSYEYCKANNLTLDTSLSLYDKGISAFKGKNIEHGDLGAFLEAVDKGIVKSGSYLLVESLDRLSRQTVSTALRLFLNILDKGIIIVTLTDGVKFDNNDLNTNDLIASIVTMSRANEESEIKSKRVLAANRSKRQNIRNKKLTSICPAWLSYDKSKNEFIPIPQKVDVIQQIFELSASGMGTYNIITELNKRNIKPIAKSDQWQSSSISKILKGREVLGDFTSKSNDGVQVFENYYPTIISEELFYRVQEGIKSRGISGGGRKGSATTNLFQKIIVCGYSIDNNKSGYRCNATNVTVIANNKASKNKKGYTYLQCATKKRSNNGCTDCRKSWRLDHFEISFLTFINEIDISSLVKTPDQTQTEINNIKSLLTKNKGQLDLVRKKIQKITTAMLSPDSETAIPNFLIKQGKSLENEESTILEIIKSEEENLKNKEYEYKTSDITKEKLSQLIDIMPTLETSDLQDLRSELSSILKNIIDRIELYPCGNITTDNFISEVRKKQGIEAANILKKEKALSNNKGLPYFIVHFKSGYNKLVAIAPKDPRLLYLSLTPKSAESMVLGNITFSKNDK